MSLHSAVSLRLSVLDLYNLSHPSSRIYVRALRAAGLLASLRLTVFPPFGSDIHGKTFTRVTAAGLLRIHTGFPFNSALAETVTHCILCKSGAKVLLFCDICKKIEDFFGIRGLRVRGKGIKKAHRNALFPLYLVHCTFVHELTLRRSAKQRKQRAVSPVRLPERVGTS